MAMVQDTVRDMSTLNRKVYVYNDHTEDYSEMFRGNMVTVPAKGKIEMAVLEANRFLSQAKAPATKLPNGKFRPGVMPKALRIEEKETAAEQHDRVMQDTARLNVTCTKCGFEAQNSQGLKIHSTRQHPGEALVDAKSPSDIAVQDNTRSY